MTVTFQRPYARIRGSEPSVTTIIGAMMDKPGLSWAAARETALYAVHHDEWRDLSPDAAVDVLRKHHRGIWDGRACMGTFAHAANQAWGAGETIDIEAMILDTVENDRQARGWQGREEEVIAAALGYIDGLERFWQDHTPHGSLMEVVVRTPNLFIGQTDWRCHINGESWLLDIKTTAEQDAEKAIYTDSWTLQLAAYRHASEQVYYEADEKGRPVEVDATEWVRVERTGVVHLRGDGKYTLYEVNTDDEAFSHFSELASAYRWLKGLKAAVPV